LHECHFGCHSHTDGRAAPAPASAACPQTSCALAACKKKPLSHACTAERC
jgi:hypothetical protein